MFDVKILGRKWYYKIEESRGLFERKDTREIGREMTRE
jgi:hypothetical protein